METLQVHVAIDVETKKETQKDTDQGDIISSANIAEIILVEGAATPCSSSF